MATVRPSLPSSADSFIARQPPEESEPHQVAWYDCEFRPATAMPGNDLICGFIAPAYQFHDSAHLRRASQVPDALLKTCDLCARSHRLLPTVCAALGAGLGIDYGHEDHP
jgi:hypothetical protein